MTMIPMRDGQRLHLRTIGRGQPVLMLHGMGMQGAHWLPFVLPHIARFRFYLPDMRGAGKSRAATYNQPDIFQNLAEDAQDLIAHCRLDDFLLAGYSLGGSTALHLLRENGFTGVRRYLHIDQAPWVGRSEEWRHGLLGEEQETLFALLRSIDREFAQNPHAAFLRDLPAAHQKALAALAADAFAPFFSGTGLQHAVHGMARWPWLFSRVFPMTHIGDLRATLRAYLSGGHDYRDDLRSCTTPVTVFVGMQSPLYHPDGQMQIAELVQNGRVVTFEKSGHVPLLSEPRKFAREFARFLRGE